MTGYVRGTAALPTGLAFAVVLAGFVTVEFVAWRPGAVLIAAGILLAALFRLVLPRRWAGWLVVRAKVVDVTLLATVGAAILVLALSIPEGP
jgi:hypothetical protein